MIKVGRQDGFSQAKDVDKVRKNSYKKRQNDDYQLIVHNDPKAVGSEAFRVLRTNLQFTSPDKPLKTILFTSAGPGEGKSTVSSNLSVAWAQSGFKVVLVGCDLRKPALHNIFPITMTPGLSTYLSGGADLQQVIKRSVVVPELDVIPSGPVPPNPAELLQSKAMTKLIETLSEQYDYVIFDCPPAIAVSDAAIMASQVDGAVLVIRANEVPKDAVLHAKILLEQANSRILGVVLTGVQPKDRKNYHYYYYYQEAEHA